MKKCALHSLGCKVNSYETQAMRKMLEESGYEIVDFTQKADIYIINTCSVTNIADRKSRQMIHKARKQNPDAVIVAAGCYTQASGADGDYEIDIALGNGEKSRLTEILRDYFESGTRITPCNISKVSEYDEMSIDKPLEHTRAYVKIQDGCNRFCSYCIIPYVRGRIRSREYNDIIEEVKRIAASGCREIVLTGIHLSSYGMEKKDGSLKLIDIIEKVNEIQGIERIRLGSLEPMVITEEFVKRLASCNKICPHFHLSLQSGCDETLNRMNRNYTVDEFKKGVLLLRRYFDNAAFTTDIITGFPGETEEEFELTEKFLEEINFYELHVFKYSRRKGTAADKMEGQLKEAVKAERSNILLKLGERLGNAYREGCIGKKVKVLLEENRIIDGKKYILGYTDTYVKTALENEHDIYSANDMVEVRIEKLFGKEMVIGVAEK